jgi:M6 family metalloprotease-like protein
MEKIFFGSVIIGVVVFLLFLLVYPKGPGSINMSASFARSQAPSPSVPTVFENNQITGWLNIWIEEDFVSGRAKKIYSFISEKGDEYRLDFGDRRDIPEVSGYKILVSGAQKRTASGITILVNNMNVIDDPDPIKTTGEQKYHGVLANFPESPEEVITPEEFNESIEDYIADYYSVVSFGSISSFSGETSGWYIFPQTTATLSCEHPDILLPEAVRNIDEEVDFRTIDHLIIAAHELSCEWSGMASVGYVSFMTDEGLIQTVGVSYVNYDDSNFSKHVFLHELGHNFGLGHASSYEGDSDPCFNMECTEDEYGHRFDIMGNNGSYHFNSLSIDKLGWFRPGNVAIMNNDTGEIVTQEITLNALEIASQGVQLIRIYKGKSRDNRSLWYGIGLRAAENFDAHLGGQEYGKVTNILRGIEMNMGSDGFGEKTYWIDMLPARSPMRYDKEFGALEAGQFISTPEGHKIEVLRRDTTTATVRVTVLPVDYLKADVVFPEFGDVDRSQGNVRVVGNVTGAFARSYLLEYGSGFYPNTWMTLASGNVPVNKKVSGKWDISRLAVDTYTIRLQVFDERDNSAVALRSARLEEPAVNLCRKIDSSCSIDEIDASEGYAVYTDPHVQSAINVLLLENGRTSPIRREINTYVYHARIWQSNIVWFENEPDGRQMVVYCKYNKNRQSCERTAVLGSSEDALRPLNRFLKMVGDWAVFPAMDGNENYFLFGKNVASGVTRSIPVDSNFVEAEQGRNITAGQISEHTVILWKERGNEMGFSTFDLDLGENGFISIPSVEGSFLSFPTLWTSQLAWVLNVEDVSGSKEYIYTCAIDWPNKACNPESLSTTTARKENLILHGNYLVWAENDRYTDRDIALFDLQTKKQRFVSIRQEFNEYPNFMNGGYIGWIANYPGLTMQKTVFLSKIY